MATSNSLVTGETSGRSLTVNWWRTAVIDNVSRISWSVVGSGSAGGGNWVTCGAMYLEINGQVVLNNATRINVYKDQVVYSGSIDIPHNADGTKSFWLSFAAGIYYFAQNAFASGTQYLDTIQRYASYLDSTPYAEVILSDRFNIAVNADVTCDNLAVSVDGAAWVYYAGDFVGWKVITKSGFSSGTAHTFKTSIRRKDSQLWSESATKNVTTADQSITDFYTQNITDTAFDIVVAVNDTCDLLSYQLDGGSWVDIAGDYTSKTIKIGGALTSGVNHTIKIKVRAKVSQRSVESSNTLTITTLIQNGFFGLI
jgi:hypothetical protein